MANRYIKILRENDISVKGGTKLGPSQVKFYQADTDNFTYSIDYTRWLDGSTISGTPTTTASACTATASNSTTVITLTVTAVSGTAEIEIQTTAADGRAHTLFMQVMERFASPYAPSIFGGGSSPTNPTLPNPSTALSMLRVNTAGNAYELRSPSEVKADLDLEIGTDVQAYDADLAAIAALSSADGNFIVGSASGWVAESGSTARASLGLGSIATQDASSVDINGGTIDGATIGGSSAGAVTCTTLTVNTSQGATTFSGNINMNANDVILRDGDTYFSNSVDNLIRYVVTASIVFDIWSTFVESWKPFLCKSYIKTESTTVGSLTAAATAGAGARSFVTDANATTFASVVAGGGSNAVPVYSDGSNWRIG